MTAAAPFHRGAPRPGLLRARRPCHVPDPSRAETAVAARTAPWRHYDLFGLMGVSLAVALVSAFG
ncbi:hypothetical protein [Streptomyces sp. NBC_00105]|uniref:hypothetical protein n=1 Tax=unclassified Streptomyces TaxID=2593676 RepID=UPI0028874A1C|nr:hypothetical protein [Streptomyces sp. DSM 41633]